MAHYIRQSGWGETACFGGVESDGGTNILDRHGFKFVTVCAYCQSVIGWVVDMSLSKDTVSHGCCPACAKIENEKLNKMENK